MDQDIAKEDTCFDRLSCDMIMQISHEDKPSIKVSNKRPPNNDKNLHISQLSGTETTKK